MDHIEVYEVSWKNKSGRADDVLLGSLSAAKSFARRLVDDREAVGSVILTHFSETLGRQEQIACWVLDENGARRIDAELVS